MNMKTLIKEVKQHNNTNKDRLYSVEEAFDQIDKKFINFYGEYGRKIVNARRTEWNQDNEANFKML